MKKIHFGIDINASREKVWKTLWEDKTYRKWTGAFGEGSYAVSDWKEGSEIQFLSPTGDGMYSRIAKSIPNKLISFRHMGVMKNGEKQPMSEETKSWSGSEEKYTLSGEGQATNLTVDMDVTDDYEEYFSKTFPKAFEIIKEIAEKG